MSSIRILLILKNAFARCWLFLLSLFFLSSCINVGSQTAEEIDLTQLGRSIFFDNRLSYNQTKSCASCHDPKFAFSDGYRRSITSTGEIAEHNSPSLINTSRQLYFDWANPTIVSLYQQSDRPLFNTHPIELGLKGHEEEILRRFSSDEFYSRTFAVAFTGKQESVTMQNIKKALEAYVSSLLSEDAAYDRFMRGDSSALSSSAKNGRLLFFSERLKCASCHLPPYFTNATITKNIDSVYFNTGLYHIDKIGYPVEDPGIEAITGKKQDNGRFKTPSLRNVAVTAPYTHDGTVSTLEEMIDIYARGGRNILAGPHAGDGRLHPYKNKLVQGFRITREEKRELIDFLFSLTDSSLFKNPVFGDPSVQKGK